MKAIEQYFNYLKDAGADVPSTVDSFKKTLSDKTSAEQYYGYLKQNDFDAPDYFDSFSKTLGLNKPTTVPVKKKDGSDPLSLDTQSVSGLNPEDPIPSISALLKQRKKLKTEKDAPKATSAPRFALAQVEVAPVIDYDSQISKINEQIKAKGYDPDELDLKFGEYDIDVDDNKFKKLYTNYNKKPFATTRQFNATTWHQAIERVQSKNPDEQLKQKNLGELQKLIADGDSLPTYDLNTAINFGRNAYQQIIALTAGDGEARDKAIENFKKDYSPVLAQIALRDKNFSSQPNLPLQMGLLYEDIFDKSKADQTRSILSQDLSGNPDAASGRDRRKYEIEEEGLSIIQSGVGEEIEGGYDKIKTWVDWQKNNIGKLSELGQKISAANPEVRATIDAANKEIASINKSVESSPLNIELKNQGEVVKQYENDYNSGIIGRDIYAAEVDKYNALAEQYNNEREQAKYKADQIVKVVNEKAASSGVSPDELKEYNRLIGEYELLANERSEADKASGWMTYFDKEKNKIVKNNPTVLADKVIMQMQEWDGENANPAERLILGFGSLVPKAKDAFGIIYDSLILPPDKKTEKDFERLGRSTSDQLVTFYEKEKDKLFQSPVITVVPDSIKKRMSEIDANTNLNDAEKEQAKKDVLRNGFISGQIYQTTNPNAGKINITGKSIINSAVTVVPQILTAAGISYATGGFGSGVAVSTFLNGYSSYYNDGVNKGLANPNQYAFAHSLVDYATEMIGTADLRLIQSAFKGSKGVGAKFFKELTDGEFKSLMAGSKNAFKNTGKAIVRNTGINAGEAVEEGFAAGGGNIVDQELFGKKTPVTQGVNESVLTTFLGQLPLTLLGIPVSVNRNNIASKYALYDAATDVNGTMAFLKKELDAGNITSQEYTDRVKLVNDYAKAIKETPATYADGNPMRDDDKAKYTFNQFISNMKADKSPLPPQQKQSIDQVIADAENENDKILSNAINQSQVQEGRTEGDLVQPQGAVQGQPEVGQGAGSQGQAEVTTANVGDSNIGGQGQVVAPELSNTESLTPDQIEVTEDATGFADQMSSAQSSLGSTGVSVTPYNQESYDEIASQGGKFLRAVGNKVLAVLKPNGEMVSLVKDATVKAKGAAQALITRMKDMGGLFMDNYDIYLTPIYEKAGYRVAARVPFDEQYAPEGWNNEDSPLKNKPDVVFMVRNDIAPDQEQSFTTYEEAQNYTQGLVDQAVNSGAAKLPTQLTKIDQVLNQTIPMATQALEQSGIKFQVVDAATDTEAARAARGNQGIFRSEDGTIIIDKSKLADEIEAGIVVWHEASHPVMNIIRNSDKPLYDAVVRGLKQAAKKNKGVAGALNWAQSQKQYNNEDTQNDESVVETIGRINAGLIDINSLDTGLRQKLIDFVNSIAKYFGIDPILNDRDIAAFKKTVSEVADALKTGRNIGEIVGQENVKEYMSNLESPALIGGGSIAIQPRVTEKPAVNVYESKETETLPKRSLQDVYDQYEGKAVVINSDPTRVGELTLPSGKKIFMYGGPGYLSLKDNVSGNVGFATTQIGKVNTWMKYVNELFGDKPGVTLVATQAPTSILSNSYALRYVMEGISQLPKSVLRSSDFKNEFFGKDLVLLKDAFGDKAYNEFVSKYKKADLSNPTVIDGMISEMAYKVGDDNNPASFKARGAFVSNLLGGIEAKKKLKTVEGDTGYVSKKPTKYISGQLFNRLGINSEKVIREIGEPSLVDLYMNEGKWGMAVSGFETDPAMTVESVQAGGVKHPLFNAKFPGKNAFVLDGAYDVNQMFSPIEMTGPSGAPYTKTAGQMLAGSMYVKGQPVSAEGSFQYQTTPAAGGAIQASAGGRDLTGKINKKLTDDGQGNYVFFHYSGKKLNKIDPSKFGANLATGRDERPGVGLSMYYVDNKTLETGVPSDFGYAVRIPKDKVYPFNEDPLNFYDQAKAEFEKDYPGQSFDANKQIGYITKVANDNGFDITVADWNIKGRKALRAQTTKSLKPEVYKQKVFKNGSEREQFNEELQKLKPGVQASVGNRSEEDLRAEGTGKERPRALASKYGNLNPATQAKIEDDATVYFERTNKQTKEAVDKFLDGLNIMDAADYVLSNPKIPEVSQVWMAAEVAKRLNAEIDAAGNNQDLIDDLTRKQADIFNEFAKRATSLGQAVQAFIAFKDNPNAVEFFLPKIIRRLKKDGVDNVTEEQRADILTLLKDVNTSAEGLPKDKAIIKLSHYLAGIAPMKPMDVLQSIWYAKILSGITTQSTNFFANIFNTVFELPAVALRISMLNGTPLGLLAGAKGFASGVAKGAVTAADIIKSGVRSKEVDKYFAENPLEYFTWSKWLGSKGKALDYIPPLNFGAWKYVGRILAATDALFATANQEAIANMLAYAEAAGTPAGNNFKKANAILGNNKMSILRARAQAKAEGFEPGTIQYKRRELEIIAQKRTGTQEADEIGKRITMNYDPEGFTKPLFDAVVALQRTIPAIKMVIPFARIVANLTENGLNYSPLGFAKAATGIKNPFQGLKSERMTWEQRTDMFYKFGIGMSTLLAILPHVGDDEDDWFEITAGGSPDIQKKYELQKGGWRPYTITTKDGTKISYKDWPIAGLLAGLGHVRDAKKYSFDDSTLTGLYAYGFFLNMYDKSLLSGLQDFFGILNVDAGRGKYAPDTKMGERATKYAAQQVKSVAISNLSQQAGKLYSELVTGDPQRDAKTFAQVIYRDIPSLNDGIRPIIDVFGDEVPYTTTERLLPVMDSPEKEKIIEWLNNNKLFVGVPMKKNIKLLDGTERPMTDEEYYEYRKDAGKGVKKFINEFIAEIKDKEIGDEAFEKVVSAAREEAYAKILMKANNL